MTRPIDERILRISFALAVLSTLPAAAFPSNAQNDADEWPETVVVIGDPNTDHEGEYREWDCEGEQFALVATDLPGCGDFGGEHVRSGPLVYGFRSINAGNHGSVPLTGTLHAQLTWADRESNLFCDWSMGEFEGCRPGIFKKPEIGDAFEFTCQSTEGAYGGWAECFIGHGGSFS